MSEQLEILQSTKRRVERLLLEPISPVEGQLIDALCVLLNVLIHERQSQPRTSTQGE